MDGEDLSMLALPAAYIADLLEAWKLMGLRGQGTYYPDITYLVPRDELANPTKEFPRRSVEQTAEACPPAALDISLALHIYMSMQVLQFSPTEMHPHACRQLAKSSSSALLMT